MTIGRSIPWTEAEVEALKELHKAKCTLEDIKMVLISRTSHAIEQKCAALGLGRPGPSPEVDMEMFKKLIGGKHGSKRM